jgi:aminopeptidase N
MAYAQVAHLATDNLFPEWKIWTQFLDISTTDGLKLDGLAESHPIEVIFHGLSSFPGYNLL